MRSIHAIRIYKFALAVTLLSLGGALGAQAPQWKSFGAAADGFRAEFPSQPEVGKTSVPVGKDTYELHSYTVEAGTTALYIGVCDYGAKGTAADPDEMLTSAKTGAVDHMSAHILTQRKIVLDKAHGVAFEAESDKLHFSVRMYMAGSVLYQAMVASPISDRYADAARFLDSFQLASHAAAQAVVVPAAEWKPYGYPTDGFSASFPAPPTIEKQNITSGGGSYELRTYEADDSATALIAAVCDYGASAASKEPDAVLEDAKKGAVNNIKGQLVSEKKITLGANHGVEFEADGESAHVTARLYVVGSVLYQMIVATPAKAKYPDTGRFLDSFQLIARPAK